MYDLHFPEIEIDPNTKGTSNDEYEKLESPWRDAILNKLNCALGDKGINELINKIKDSSKLGLMLLFLQSTTLNILLMPNANIWS